MPIYEYSCAACGHHWELIVARDAALPDCPECGKPGRKAVSAPAFQFKGTGWYVTDYAKSGSEGKKAAKSDGKPAEGKGAEPAPAAAKADAPTPAPAQPAAAAPAGNGK